LKRLVSEKLGIFSRELKWNHIRPTEIDDADVEVFVYNDVVARQIPMDQHMRCIIEIGNPEL
jgi:hypothetical protein